MKLKALLMAVLLFAAPNVYAGSCEEGTLEVRQNGVRALFRVELAVTRAEQARGLMFRESMPQSEGMLFIYARPQSVSFWMRNTLIPLDMLFIGQTGVVKTLHHNAVPLDETSIPGGEGIQYVLEINGGLSQMLGFSAGAEIRYIGFPQENAIWPCE